MAGFNRRFCGMGEAVDPFERSTPQYANVNLQMYVRVVILSDEEHAGRKIYRMQERRKLFAQETQRYEESANNVLWSAVDYYNL